MEKFAVDLDKVLDDFEFNEDCAEQVTSLAPASVYRSQQRPDDRNSPALSDNPSLTNSDERRRRQSNEKIHDTIDMRKTDTVHNNGDTINDFCPKNYQKIDDKVQEKEIVDFCDTDEPVSLTIYNDITKKIVQKQQNDRQIAKNHNSYDKKLNQPNIKPSVSNVFNSLNEYINASSGTMEYINCSVDCEKDKNVKIVSNLTDSDDEHITNDKKIKSILPAYQNILLPIKCEPTSGNQIPNIDNKNDDLNLKCGMSCKTGTLDCSKHIYENVEIGTNRIATRKSTSRESSRSSSQDETKHIYENVDFQQAKDKNNIYECIYIGNDELPETTTELEIAAKRLTEQFPININCIKKNTSDEDKEIKENIESTKTIFHNVNININERKPVGFSTIDDLSEDELNKYLAELEAEERSKEKVIYENINLSGSSSVYKNSSDLKRITTKADDEDADEAPIFESVTIGELPCVSEEKLQEKSKKLRVIDYSKCSTSDRSSDFLEKKLPEKFPETVKITSEIKEKDIEGTGSISMNSANDSTNEVIAGANDGQNEQEMIDEFSEKSTSKCDESTDTTDNNEVLHAEDDKNWVINENLSGSSNRTGDEPDNPGESSSTGNIQIEEDVISEEDRGLEEFEKIEDTGEKLSRPQTLDIVSTISMDESSTAETPDAALNVSLNDVTSTQDYSSTIVDEPRENQRDPSPDASDNSSMEFGIILGKQPPFWVPDCDAPNCMLCDVKFNVIKRRHHCRACGKVLCNKCCSMKYRLEYQGNMDSRVCALCYQQLVRAESEPGDGEWSSGMTNNTDGINSPQLAGNLLPPPTVMVPVGVLKREGSTKHRTEGQKSVMFSDGIRPGCDLTELDTSWDLKPPYRKSSSKRITSPGQQTTSVTNRQILPPLNPQTNSYIPEDENVLPPTVTIHKGQISYHEIVDPVSLYKSLKNECEPPVMFAINRNLYAYVKITNLNCCVNKICWNVTSRGLACVGQDEVIFLIETQPEESQIPRDLLIHINQIYVEAIKGNTVTEHGVSIHHNGNLLGSREHAGFLFIRQTFQCLQKIVLPPSPFLFGLLVHRWETPWAKIFPLRLVLRLGAEYRYYPCPLVSVRYRDAVYFEIGHTIMKVLADFRNYAYTLPGVRGMVIHMQDRTTNVLFPRNRYDQVIKGLNNSNDHVLAFASNFSVQADSHLVCIQTNKGDESNYQTQAINIHNKPRKLTGASFVVINGALKSSMGLSAKSSIVEDGLMVQIMPEKMEALKASLKNMQDFIIDCGKQGLPEPDETVNIKWTDNDTQFNLGVKSPIDNKQMDGIPSIRVHNGTDYMGTSRFIRWTEVFIIKSDDHPSGVHDPVDINKISESIARATCTALVKLLDLLAAAGLTKLAVRATIHPDNVGYEAGSEGTRLPPIYMNSLDNELIQVLHKAAQSSQETNTVLELIFHVLDD